MAVALMLTETQRLAAIVFESCRPEEIPYPSRATVEGLQDWKIVPPARRGRRVFVAPQYYKKANPRG
ncbi:MAG: hypothetical protein DMG07_19910 [Acidobacteria bacterium]|nr:MAG: hypothetical protein DMG07_19910 [Acidobacteriota bacterium]